MATHAPDPRETIIEIVARHQQVAVTEVTDQAPLGPEAVFIIADVEEELDRYLTSEVKHALYQGNVEALIAAFQDPA